MRPIKHQPPIKRFRRARHLVLLTTLITGCVTAPWEENKLKDLPPEVRADEAKKAYEQQPESTKLKKDKYLNQESAANELNAQAMRAREQGDFTEAQRLYDLVLAVDPDNQTALANKLFIANAIEQREKLEKAKQLSQNNQLEQAKKEVHEVLLENPQHKSALILDTQLNKLQGNANNEPPQLKPASDKPVSLELRDANIKVVFEALSRATGINFILDKDIKPETKANIFIKKLPVEEAIDMVLSSNGLQKKALSENTALIFPASPQKLKDYQDLKIRSFYLNNTSAKQVSAMLKTMLKTKDVVIDERINMIVMRDTPEVVRIAEKLVMAADIADSEVMLDIEVLEVSRSRIQELGIEYPNKLAVLGAQTGLTLEALKGLDSSGVGVSPNPALNFRKVIGDVNVLSNPRIRVKNNEKAKILVGDKIPIITTTSTANVGISENVTYVDVGLKLDVEPRVTLDDFVNIKVGLEVSSLGERTVTRNGAVIFNIGTRSANTVLRLKDGETQILAGLISDDERKNATRLPGIGDVPILGRLFANQEDRKTKTEIVLAITPRVVSNLAIPKSEVSEYWSGTETIITDKPQKSLPPMTNGGAAAMTPIERLREQRRLREIELNASQESTNAVPSVDADTQQNPAAVAPTPPSDPAATPVPPENPAATPAPVQNTPSVRF
jgi:general secretion pathway protein D